MNLNMTIRLIVFLILVIMPVQMDALVYRVFDFDLNIITYAEVESGVSVIRFIGSNDGEVHFFVKGSSCDGTSCDCEKRFEILYYELESRYEEQQRCARDSGVQNNLIK